MTRLERVLIRLLSLLVVLASPVSALADDYVIGCGDTLEVSVLNVPALRHRGVVGPEGKVMIPGIGAIDADGLTVVQLGDNLEKAIVAKNLIRDPTVAIDVVEYRPVYVSGEVARPGAYTYRPNMTVQQAVVEAGGYGPLIESRGVSAMLEVINLRTDTRTIAVDLTRQQLKAARLAGELDDLSDMRVGEVLPDIDPATAAGLMKTERDQFVSDKDDQQRRKTYYEHMIQSTTKLIGFLTDAADQLSQAMTKQTADIERALDLQRRGVATIARTEDEQRAIVLLRNQMLDVRARSQQAYNDLENYTRDLNAYQTERRARVLQELTAASSEEARLRLQLAGARDKLRVAGGIGFRQAPVPKVMVSRGAGKQWKRFEADQNSVIMPGDVVEITIPQQQSLG